jgi:hypothetical protein
MKETGITDWRKYFKGHLTILHCIGHENAQSRSKKPISRRCAPKKIPALPTQPRAFWSSQGQRQQHQYQLDKLFLKIIIIL